MSVVPDLQTYRTHAHVRCLCPDCHCESVVEATGAELSPTTHMLRRDTQLCPVCRHSSAHHECLGEIPFAGRHSH